MEDIFLKTPAIWPKMQIQPNREARFFDAIP
jgi:hypothetical protein